MKTPVTTALLLVAGLGASLWAGCHANPKAEGAEPAPKVSGDRLELPAGSPQLSPLAIETVAPSRGATLRLNGRVLWDDEVTVRIFTPFAGRVMKIAGEVGQTVVPNQPLALIASADYGQAQADARKAASDLRLTERTATRIGELFAHGAAAKKDLDAAEADLARAHSESERASARLGFFGGGTETVDQVYQLKAPIGGVLVEKNINPGQEVRPDQILANAPQFTAPLFVVTDPTRLWIQLDAAEHDLSALKPGQPFVAHTRNASGPEIHGQVEVISDFLDPATRTVKVRGTIDNTARLLKAEMFVSVELPVAQTVGIDVPARAVFLKGEKHFLYLQEGPGRFVRREVVVGPEHDGKVVVVGGVELGQRVVTDGCLLLEALMEAGRT